jgi:glutaredoxin
VRRGRRACAWRRTASPCSAWPTRRRRGGSIRSPADVVLFHSPDCHLCERARAQLSELREELDFELREVDITGDPELEARYRELIPVVEIDGVQEFVYYVQPAGFRRKLRRVR